MSIVCIYNFRGSYGKSERNEICKFCKPRTTRRSPSCNKEPCSSTHGKVQGKQIKRAATTKYLGIKIHENMTWSDHIRDICSKINRRIGILKQVHYILPRQELVTLYNSIVLPLMDYGDLIWGDENNKLLMKDLQIMQNKAAKVILGLPIMYLATAALHNLQWTPLLERRQGHCCVAVYKCLNDLMEVEYNMITNNMVHSYSTRGKNNLHLPKVKMEWGKQRFPCSERME